MKKIYGLLLLGMILLMGGVFAAFLVSTFDFTFPVFEPISVKYAITNPFTECEWLSASAYVSVPNSQVTATALFPGDERRVCLKISSQAENPIAMTLNLTGNWNPSIIEWINITQPDQPKINSPKYGSVDYKVRADANGTFAGKIEVSRG